MDRERLCITIKKDLLKKIDILVVDGVEIRNRSHAIEYLLSKNLGPKVKKAFILAGGHGIKMRPFTYEMPKAMLPVKGRPILEYIIDSLRESGLRDVIILIGPKGEKIKEHFGDGSKFGIRITYAEEGKKSGTSGSLRKVANLLAEGPFLLMYGDVLTEINLDDFIGFHETQKSLATVALTSVEDPSAYGAVKMHGNKIVEFREKPKKAPEVSRLVNAGIFILDPKVINYTPKKGFSMLEKDVFPKLAKEGRLYGYLFEGRWYDVGTPEVYEKVIKEWQG